MAQSPENIGVTLNLSENQMNECSENNGELDQNNGHPEGQCDPEGEGQCDPVDTQHDQGHDQFDEGEGQTECIKQEQFNHESDHTDSCQDKQIKIEDYEDDTNEDENSDKQNVVITSPSLNASGHASDNSDSDTVVEMLEVRRSRRSKRIVSAAKSPKTLKVSTRSKSKSSVQYHIVKGGTSRGRDKLCDSLGYSYCKRKTLKGRCTWSCSIRNKTMTCPAIVVQTGKQFLLQKEHNHPVPTLKVALCGKRDYQPAKKRSRTSPLTRMPPDENRVNCTVVSHGTTRGRPKLFDETGYSYCMRRSTEQTNTNVIQWACSIRRRDNRCRVKINQFVISPEESVFVTNCREHTHPVLEPMKKLREMDLEDVDDFFKQKIQHNPEAHKRIIPRRKRTTKDFKVRKPPNENRIGCTIIEQGTDRGRPKLFDNDGYSYCVRIDAKKVNSNVTQWACSVKRRANSCPVRIFQYSLDGEEPVFITNRREHSHTLKPARKKAVEMKMEIKRRALEEPFRSSMDIAREVYENGCGDEECQLLPKIQSMARKASLHRQSQGIKEPESLDFELSVPDIPSDFLLKDMKMGYHRHVLFATSAQLEVLSGAATWYIDATSSLVKKPFTHLLTVSVFVETTDAVEFKHVPLAYCLMSKRRQEDYKLVLEALQECVGGSSLTLVVAVFDEGLWGALGQVYPGVDVRGCAYNFKEDIIDKVKSMNLEEEYGKNDDFRNYVNRLMSLPYLQVVHISPEFMFLRSMGEDDSVRGLVNFIDNRWILSTDWPVTQWSSFNRLIRNKKDHEDWKTWLRKQAHAASVKFYHLVQLLHRQAEGVSPQSCTAIADEQLLKHRSDMLKGLQVSLKAVWESYMRDDLAIDDIVTQFSKLIERPTKSK